ncbi:hypothetical protein GLOTRDRAFT_137483 [Gloeophyllum trabeum ATCC 11539]|uniref:Protein kinase domain-containing protein n=1 Tax=Gloeophyllum trabeum (strain ATCC 11539 / FP-39264 / Madison 617) TaxID=670483 RepID=S7RR36_GLOTA|nr:uncharacterized protein GLOTRDRAFT_137483 [Gloeophyllum trabeum ATCC 11539]EPQ57055.1 hypothetical protein GLOTRDRAFT_137483 [Gloeophyllum trabeum ATCC 11539]
MPQEPAVKTTPYAQKLSSHPISHDDGAAEMGKKVDRELDPYRSTRIGELIDHIFPEPLIPGSDKTIDDIYSAITTGDDWLFSATTRTWKSCPNLSVASNNGDVEVDFASFLNTLATRISVVVGKECRRIATGAYAGNRNHLPGGPGSERRPDVLFFEKEGPQSWETVISHWEVKNKHKYWRQARTQVGEGARLIYESQYDRRFVVAASILGFDIILHLLDRAGEVSSATFDMRGQPRAFLRIFTATIFSEKDRLGYDPSITTLEDGRRCVTVAQESYVIEDWVYRSHSIRGRGTACWRASRNGVTYAIKDYWTDMSRAVTEAEFLREAENHAVEGVPRLVAHEVAEFRGQKDTTKLIRPILSEEMYSKMYLDAYTSVGERVHMRLVMTPFAMPITHFKTKGELVGAFIDVIEAHKQLVEKANILHRDISVNNIMLVESSDQEGKNGRRRGLLIDLDYAAHYSPDDAQKDRKVALLERTGTTPFMAIDLLSASGQRVHVPRWDLESFFYVLIWVFILYDGPCKSERKIKFSDTVLFKWTNDDFESIGMNKYAAVTSPDFWESKVLRWVAPYFADLKPCLTRIRDLLFFTEEKTHDKFIRILQEEFEKLPDEGSSGDEEASEENLPTTQTSAVEQFRSSYAMAGVNGLIAEGRPDSEWSGKQDDEGAEGSDSAAAGPSHSWADIASTGSRGRKRTAGEIAESRGDYTESGISPDSRSRGWVSDPSAFRTPSPVRSPPSWGSTRVRAEGSRKSHSRGPTSSESSKRHRGQ